MSISINTSTMRANISTDRFSNQFKNAKKVLNTRIVADSTPYIPFQQGQLRSQVRYPDGIYGDTIEWYAPYAHYQYMGELYVTRTGSPYASRGEKKYPTGKKLKYHEPETGCRWFEKAKQTHGTQWIAEVRRVGGGGTA